MRTRGLIRVGLDAHVLGRRGSGNETYTRGLAEALATSADADLVLYVDREAGHLPTGRVTVRRLAFYRAQPRIALELPIRARRDRLDLLHMQYVVPPALGLPVVTTVHDVSFLEAPDLLPTARRLRLRATVSDAIRRSAVVLTPSDHARDRLLQHYAIAPERVFAAPPLAHLPAHPEPASEADARAIFVAFGLDTPFVLAVGELQPRKNVARLVEAMAIARSDGLNAALVLAGRRGWRANEIDQAIERHRAESWVRILDYVPSPLLASLYRSALLVAFVSLYEGFGLPALEAMAAGTPVLASTAGSIPEVVGDGAILVDPLDIPAMAHGLRTLALDDARRRSVIARGTERARHYRSTATVDAYLAAYRAALGR